MKNRVTTAVASAGLCFVAVLPSPSLAFRFPTLGRSHNHASLARNSRQQFAASRVVMTASSKHANNIGSSEDTRRRENSSMTDSPKKKSSARTDVAALVLSALLLGGIPPGGMGVANANAAARVGAIGSGPLHEDTVKQAKLIADLEQRLLNMKPMETQQTQQPERPATADEAPSLTPSGSESSDSAAESLQTSRRTQPILGAGGANTNDESATVASQSADAAATAAVAAKVDVLKPANSEPFVTFHEHTFSVTVPEFNLPPIGPILLPEEGFGAPEFPRVTAAPVPFGGVLRGILQKAGDSGEVLRSIVGFVPKQSDFERAVTEFEQRVQHSIHTAQNPLFPSGALLDPGFTSMFSAAKQTAAKSLGLKPNQIEPTTDLAIFMLATLPVLTVALRAADENSRRPMPPRGQITPRIVRFPNSPAKVDRKAVEEARAAQAAAAAAAAAASVAPTSVVPGANAETVAIETLPKEVKTIVAKEILTGVGLGGDVAAAVAADPVVLQAELTRLRNELQSATKLAEKVRALEQANARLSSQVAELSRRPAPEELLRQAEQREARAAAERERAERQSTLRRSVAERTYKLAAAREKLVQAFPISDPLLGLGDEAEGRENTVGDELKRETQEEEEEGEKESVWVAVNDGTSVPETKVDAATSEQGPGLPVTGQTMNGIPMVESAQEAAGTLFDNAPSSGRKADKKKSIASALLPENDREESAVNDESSPSSWLPAAKSREKVVETKSESVGVKEVNNGEVADAVVAAGDLGPDDYDELSDGLSRALGGVRGFDLDALDLEMEDLGPEDLEELRNLEREMGDLDMASLEAEFDQEDDESISNALRMAAESAMAHTSGGRRSRIRTATGMGSSSAPMPPPSPARNSGSGATGAEVAATGLESEGISPRGDDVKVPKEEGFDLMDLEWNGYPMIPREGEGKGEGEGEGEGERQTELAAAPPGRADKSSGSDEGGAADGWGSLTASALKRKTVPELKGFLEQRGVQAAEKAKKAELVELVSGLLQTA